MIIEYIRSLEDVLFGKGASEEDVSQYEKALQLKFSDEYKEYLKEFGNVEINASELTGISRVKRLDVVVATEEARSFNTNVSDDLYVIEQTNIDGIIIWQDRKGMIYETRGLGVPEKICDSLEQYIQEYCI